MLIVLKCTRQRQSAFIDLLGQSVNGKVTNGFASNLYVMHLDKARLDTVYVAWAYTVCANKNRSTNENNSSPQQDSISRIILFASPIIRARRFEWDREDKFSIVRLRSHEEPDVGEDYVCDEGIELCWSPSTTGLRSQ